MEYIHPLPLEKGDLIAIIAPSGGAGASSPHRLENAKKFLEKKGFKVKLYPNTAKRNGYESAPAKERANEIMAAFMDKGVKAIICQIGGSTINRTLRHLDYEKIKENPKIFCGYSDISVLHYALLKKSNLLTYYGPCAMTQFGEFPEPIEYTVKQFNKAIINNHIGVIEPSKKWTDEILDWKKRLDLERPRKFKDNPGYEWLKKGNAKGKILGGCLPSICHLLGTEFWPDHKNSVLFIELPEGAQFDKGISLANADAYLCDLELAGIFAEIKGLIVGRPFRYTEEQVEKFKKIILDITKNYNFPILYGADIGHTDPQITIPLGNQVEIDSERNLFRFID